MQISLEEFSTLIAAIHTAAASPERWPEVFSAVARLANAPETDGEGDGRWEKLLGLEALDDHAPLNSACEPSVRRVIELLAPHLRTARQVQMRLAEALPGRLALASLDQLAVAAFIVNPNGVTQHANASARTLVADGGCGVRLRGSRLRFQEPRVNAAFETALQRATQSPFRSSLLPMSSGKEGVFEVTVSPLDGHPAGPPSAPSSRLALVVVGQSQPDAERIALRARRLFGLTEAEARVMAALSLGETVEEIAEAHGVRITTVRAQVRSLFEKTGVHRQSDLVRLALGGAPLLNAPDH